MMQHLGRRYVRYLNSRYHRTGTLWEGRFKSCLVDSTDYVLKCQRYIELNPVRARMVATRTNTDGAAIPCACTWYCCRALDAAPNIPIFGEQQSTTAKDV